MIRIRMFFSISVILAALFVAGCVAGLPQSEVTFDISMIEIKGSTDGIPPPEDNPLELSAGYRYKAPGEYDADNPDKWQVSSYMFSPAAMTVAQGDKVNLRIFGVNGDEHVVWLEGPDGSTVVDAAIMNRGREYNVEFAADQAGYYTLHCGNHAPTMTASIFALPSYAQTQTQ